MLFDSGCDCLPGISDHPHTRSAPHAHTVARRVAAGRRRAELAQNALEAASGFVAKALLVAKDDGLLVRLELGRNVSACGFGATRREWQREAEEQDIAKHTSAIL